MPRPEAARAALGAGLAALAIGPVVLAAFSPYLSYRGPAYIVGGFAGIACLSILLIQPLLPAGYLPGVGARAGRALHRWTGAAILAGVALHVGGLYLASPPDTLDALLLRAPTAFSLYGVLALWAFAITGVLVALRPRIPGGPRTWRRAHNALALVAVVATVVHAVLIEGAMEPVSKWILCGAVLAGTLVALVALVDLRLLRPRRGRHH